MYIRANCTLQNVGKRATMLFLLATSQVTTFTLTALYVYNKQRHWNIDDCLEDIGSSKVFDLHQTNVAAVLMILCQAELVIHVYLSLYLYKKNLQVKSSIPHTSYKKRNVSNAIDFSGHFLHYAFELGVMFFGCVGESGVSAELAEYSGISIMCASGILPIILTSTSANLQHELATWLHPITVLIRKMRHGRVAPAQTIIAFQRLNEMVMGPITRY